MLRGFEREGEAATVQEWRCEVDLSGRGLCGGVSGDSDGICPESQHWRGRLNLAPGFEANMRVALREQSQYRATLDLK